jgi:hypothetical protein
MSIINMSAKCHTNDTDCLLRTLVDANSGCNWNPLNFAFNWASMMIAVASAFSTTAVGPHYFSRPSPPLAMATYKLPLVRRSVKNPPSALKLYQSLAFTRHPENVIFLHTSMKASLYINMYSSTPFSKPKSNISTTNSLHQLKVHCGGATWSLAPYGQGKLV